MLILVRHGRTDANAAGLLLGRADPPLDDVGQEQARALGKAFEGKSVRAVVSSPLGRARTTAEAIAERADVKVAIDERWVELDYGELDQRSPAEVSTASWTGWRADPAWAPPGGESLLECGERVRAACEALRDRAAVENVVVVSHVSPIKAATAWALGVGDEVAWRMFVGTGSITRVGITEAGPMLRSFNEVSHLH